MPHPRGLSTTAAYLGCTRYLRVGIAVGMLMWFQPGGAAAESFAEAVLRILGVSAAPQMRAVCEQRSGDIWLADLHDNSRRPLTTDGGYRSPIFSPDNRMVYALRNDKLVSIEFDNGAIQDVRDAPNLIRLIGFDRAKNNQLLVVAQGSGGAVPQYLSVNRSAPVSVLFDQKSDRDAGLLAYLCSDDRSAGKVHVYAAVKTGRTARGKRTTSDIFIERGDDDARNISECAGHFCVEPAISGDETRVLYLRAE